MKVSNSKVASYWGSGKNVQNHGGSFMISPNGDVYSYDLRIGYINDQGEKIALRYNKSGVYYSQTTSMHVSRLMSCADRTIHPNPQEPIDYQGRTEGQEVGGVVLGLYDFTYSPTNTNCMTSLSNISFLVFVKSEVIKDLWRIRKNHTGNISP